MLNSDNKVLANPAQLQATLNVIPAYTWYASSSGGLTFVNKRTADYLGLPTDHPLRLGNDTGAAWDAHIPFLHPDDREETRRVWSTCLRTGEAGEVSFRVRNAQGEYRWFLSRAEPLRASDGTLLQWVGVNLDIEQLKRAEQALMRSEAYLTQAQKLTRTGSWAWDPRTEKVLYCSEEMFRIFGLDPRKSSPSRDNFRQQIHPEDRDWVKKRFEESHRERVDAFAEYRVLLLDGTVRHINASGHPVLSEDGEFIEFIGTAADVTERKREAQKAENELRATQAHLARASQAATIAELSASIAHEINQPLAGIVASAQTCRTWLSGDNPNLPRAQAAIERIIRDGNAAADIIRRIRALFKQTAPTKTPMSINAVIEEVGRLAQHELSRRGVSIELELTQALPMVPVDRIQIQQVLVNLIRNGAEAMENANSDPKRLIVRSHCTDGCVVLEVCDFGPGLTHPDKAFEPFYSTKQDGLGVGLAISRSIVHAHGGVLRARDNQPHGTTFWLTLPLWSEASP